MQKTAYGAREEDGELERFSELFEPSAYELKNLDPASERRLRVARLAEAIMLADERATDRGDILMFAGDREGKDLVSADEAYQRLNEDDEWEPFSYTLMYDPSNQPYTKPGGSEPSLDHPIHSVVKDFAESKRDNRLPADKIVRQKGFWPAVGDFFSPGGSGGARAGAAVALNDAAGVESSDFLRHPVKTNILGGTTGAILGALSGAAVGGGLGLAGGGGSGARAGLLTVGGISGGLAGGALGLLAAYLARRRGIREAGENYDAETRQGSQGVDPERVRKPSSRYGILSKILSPYSGSWRAGNARARQMMLASDPDSHSRLPSGRVLNDIAPISMHPVVQTPLALAGGIAGHLGANRREREIEREHFGKTAAVITKLASKSKSEDDEDAKPSKRRERERA